MATVATTAYLPAPGVAGVGLAAAVFLTFGTCSASLWVLAGRTVARLLKAEWHLRAFNIAMALLLLASLFPLLAE
jgi:threonine/homoserine/homoserine lactone efflux protein